LALSRGREDSLDVETVLGGLFLAGAPDFIDDGVAGHYLFSEQFLGRADDRAFACVFPTN
jgi:hypothetical protein